MPGPAKKSKQPADKKEAISVLVFDDKEAYRKLIRTMLDQPGDLQFDLLEAADGKALNAALNAHAPDVVILDLELKGESGMDWLEEIRRRNIAPVVIITGHGSEQIAVDAMKRGAYDYIPKAYLTYDQLSKSLVKARESWNLRREKEELQQKLAHMAMYDALTDILSRRAIIEQIESETQRTNRYDRQLSILMVDIDHFKRVNDTYGHVAGDGVLKEVARALYRKIRRSDFVGRYGGEEFLVVLPETSLAQAIVLGEKLRLEVSKMAVEVNGTMLKDTTVSIGAAQYGSEKTVDEFINHSDRWLYEAKHNGRNQIQPTQAQAT